MEFHNWSPGPNSEYHYIMGLIDGFPHCKSHPLKIPLQVTNQTTPPPPTSLILIGFKSFYDIKGRLDNLEC